MTKLVWDEVGDRTYETGVDHGVLYVRDDQGDYPEGVAWNGLTGVTESPSGAASTPQYADNMKYLDLTSTEIFGATIAAFTYPDEWAQCDGTTEPVDGIAVGQQPRKVFGMCYRTKKGNDVIGDDFGFKLHLVYGAKAAPSERAYATVNDTPAALAFSWTVTTTPVIVSGYKPTALLTLDSSRLDETAFGQLMDILYGTSGADPRLPLPDEVIALFTGTVTTVVPTAPTYVEATHTVTIPTVAGVQYYIDGDVVPAGAHVIPETKVVVARPTEGHVFADETDDDWEFVY